MELTQKVIKVIKDVDKLFEDVKKDAGRIAAGAKGVKDMFRKPGSEQK